MRDRRVNQDLARKAILLWIAVIVTAYYVAHEPFDVSDVRALGKAIAGLGAAALVVALGSGLGFVLSRQVELGSIERLIWAAVLGLGAISLLGFAVGAAGFLRPWVLWALTVAGLVATAWPLWRALRDARSDPGWQPQGCFEAMLAGYCVFMLNLGLTY